MFCDAASAHFVPAQGLRGQESSRVKEVNDKGKRTKNSVAKRKRPKAND